MSLQDAKMSSLKDKLAAQAEELKEKLQKDDEKEKKIIKKGITTKK